MLEPEGMADVFAGRSEHLRINVDQTITPTMPPVPSDGPGHGVFPRIADPLVQVEVAHGVRDDGRAEHLGILLRDEFPEVDVWVGERGGIGRHLSLDQTGGPSHVTLPVKRNR